MRNYYFEAFRSVEDRRDYFSNSDNYPKVYGWVSARNFDECEKIIRQNQLIMDGIWNYTKAEREARYVAGQLELA